MAADNAGTPIATRGAGSSRDLWLLGTGVLISTAGDAAALVALLLRLRPEGAGWISALLGAQLLPAVLGAPVVGRLVDRYDNRKLLVVALAGQAVVAIPLALFRTPGLIVGTFFVLAALNAAVRPATSALVPAISGEERAASGYAWIATGTGIGWIVGPAAGGLLTAGIGPTGTLLVDAATFLVLAVACSRLRAERVVHHPAARNSGGAGGGAFLWRDRTLRVSLFASALTVGCAVIDNVAAPYRFIDQLNTTSLGYGGYLALWGVGALAGAQYARRPAPPAQVLALGNLLVGVGIAGIGLSPTLWMALIAATVGGAGNGLANVAANTLVVDRIAPADRGRAFAATAGLIQAATGVGTAAAAPLVSAFGAGHVMTGAGILAALVAAATLLWARLQVPRFLGR